ASEADLQSWIVGKCLLQRLEGHLLAPFPFDVQQVADIAELAVQVAPHRRFVDRPHGQPIRAAGFFIDEATDPLLVQSTPVTRPGMTSERQRASTCREGFPELCHRTSKGTTRRLLPSVVVR